MSRKTAHSGGGFLKDPNQSLHPVSNNGIGTLQEKSLHAALKQWYARAGDQMEVPVDGFLVDIVRDGLLIEIQTRNFSALKRKLIYLTSHYPVRLVYPIAQEKWIVRLDGKTSQPVTRRKSPKRGRTEHIFVELVHLAPLLVHPNFSLEVLLTREEEVQVNDGKGSWRRKGWSIADRRLIGVVERVSLEAPANLLAILPPNLPETFTTRELARSMGAQRYLAAKMAYCLREAGLLTVVGKRKRAYLYRTDDKLAGL